MNEKFHGFRRVRALAWVAICVSALATFLQLSAGTSAMEAFYQAVFGYDFAKEIFLLAVTYVVALVLDIVAAIALKGWQNRAAALTGVLILLIPVGYGIWIANSY